MFCPKCGTENPETGKFCRSCGTDLGNVSDAISGKLALAEKPVDCNGKPVSWEGAITTIFMGVAFLVVSIVLGFTGWGRGWWFWMMIPAFAMLGSGVAKYVQLKKTEQQQNRGFAFADPPGIASGDSIPSLPPTQTHYVPSAVESRYKTGDLVPPSVIEPTTRHLKTDSEGETMTLPKSS
ncbi:MAG: zinc-ribbon domain-containing protein [Acidobacteria bacterium]|nr:zinc-ribbon domain-containing protein [Acidobacteriota bacterium]MCA1608238.1 zinc-ribbon domain-containing protein [Acidobacteriota bacterium]